MATLRGSTQADTLNGGDAADLIVLFGGDDRALGGAGADVVAGGLGDDALSGESDGDRLSGGTGDDRLFGGADEDLLFGGEGKDRLNGGSAADRLYGGAFPDSLWGNRGNDLLAGGNGDDLAAGEDGNDTVLGGGGTDSIDGADGEDSLFGGNGGDRLAGGAGNDRLFGGAGSDTLWAGPGEDHIGGGTGSDVLVLPGGPDDYRIVTRGDYTRIVDLDTTDGDTGTDHLSGVETIRFATIETAALGPDAALILRGVAPGATVAGAGDLNGDGIDDVVVGSPLYDAGARDSGIAYVVFGSDEPFGRSVTLTRMNDGEGFAVTGTALRGRLGQAVDFVGDVNGDGIDDLLLGATGEEAAFMLFGSRKPFDTQLDLSALPPSHSVRLDGIASDDATGYDLRAAGDINGDGVDDFVIGAPGADRGHRGSGAAYVVFGRRDGELDRIDLARLDGRDGFAVIGAAAYDGSGTSVAGAGDFNGDGFDDLIIASDGAGNGVGGMHIVFGAGTRFPSTLRLGSLESGDGFEIRHDTGGSTYLLYSTGASLETSAVAGSSVAGAGDINGDGFDDVAIGTSLDYDYTPPPEYSFDTTLAVAGDLAASTAEPGLRLGFVVFGNSRETASLATSALDGRNGFALVGGYSEFYAQAARWVSSAGDLNGDGFDDVVVSGFDDTRVVFGSRAGFGATVDLRLLDGSNGFVISGAGGPARTAGDLNHDGLDDLVIGGDDVLFGSMTGLGDSISLA